MLIALSRRLPVSCRSILTGVALLGEVSHRFNIHLVCVYVCVCVCFVCVLCVCVSFVCVCVCGVCVYVCANVRANTWSNFKLTS